MSDAKPVDVEALRASADLWDTRGRPDAAAKLEACLDEIVVLRRQSEDDRAAVDGLSALARRA